MGVTDRSGLAGHALDVGPRLLGVTLRSTAAEGTVAVVLTEVEAYGGADDPASHAYRGSTPRTRVMFGPPGRLYVYRSYGIHACLNVVTGPDGEASAVLLRAGRVIEGHELARSRRGERVEDDRLARGPGCLGQALGIGLDSNGVDLLGDGAVRVRDLRTRMPGDIRCGPRVGVRLAFERAWRFWLAGEASVSAYRRSPRACGPATPGESMSNTSSTGRYPENTIRGKSPVKGATDGFEPPAVERRR